MALRGEEALLASGWRGHGGACRCKTEEIGYHRRPSRGGYDIYAAALKSRVFRAFAHASGVRSLICQLVELGRRVSTSRKYS
jgi:hypothetical protein